MGNTADYLARAREQTIVVAPSDASTGLAITLGQVGLSRIHALQESYGLRQDAMLVIGPDASPSRNKFRFRHGFLTGAKYLWGDGDTELVPLGLGCNGCGLCTISLDTGPKPEEVYRKLKALSSSPPKIDGIPIQMDFSVSNHFVGLFEIATRYASLDFDGELVAIIHCSCPELKSSSPLEFGLDLSTSPRLQESAKYLQSQIGTVPHLFGKDARRYYELCQYANWFAKEKRAIIGNALFPDGKILSNRMHLGLATMNECLLGCQEHCHDSASHIYPFLLGPNASSYLISTDVNLSGGQMDGLGYVDTLSPHTHGMRGASIVPHSGGYAYDYIGSLKVALDGEHSEFQVEVQTLGGNRMLIPDMTDMPYGYKSQSVLSWCEKMGVCTRVVELRPKTCWRT